MTRQISDRITVNPKQCGGHPCIRGMRIRVSDVLDLFAAGLSPEQILEEMPDLEYEDLQAAMGNVNCVSTPYTQPDTIRVEMIPGGNGEVIKFNKDSTGNVRSLSYAGVDFERIQ